jgi:hypothetical protein
MLCHKSIFGFKKVAALFYEMFPRSTPQMLRFAYHHFHKPPLHLCFIVNGSIADYV